MKHIPIIYYGIPGAHKYILYIFPIFLWASGDTQIIG